MAVGSVNLWALLGMSVEAWARGLSDPGRYRQVYESSGIQIMWQSPAGLVQGVCLSARATLPKNVARADSGLFVGFDLTSRKFEMKDSGLAEWSRQCGKGDRRG